MPQQPLRPPVGRRSDPRRRTGAGLAWLMAAGLVVAPSPRMIYGQDRPGLARDGSASTPDERARAALEAANALDEQALRATSAAESRSCWSRAVRLLDDAIARDPQVPTAASLRFQAAVYTWADARTGLDEADLRPAADPEVLRIARGLDDAIARLRALPGIPVDLGDPFAQNVRFRLAQALADRARLRPEADPVRAGSIKEAQELLDRSITSPRLRPFARLLHAELANRLGQYGPAQVEVEEAEKLNPPPPVIPLTDAKLAALAGRGLFADAGRVVDRSAVGPEQKSLWKLRLVLTRRRAAKIGADLAPIDGEAFALAAPLRGSNRPEARRGLMELARTIEEPPADAPADWWETLADGHLLLGEPARAAGLAARGADDAKADRARAALRLKAGGCWFQAEQFAEADAALGRVLDDSLASGSDRAKAGMLRALARGRALAGRRPGSSAQAYQAALEAQVRDFPADPVTGEARWLLGKLRMAAHRREEAIALWAGIPHGRPRWLEARANAADAAIDAVDDQWINRDQAAVRPRLDAARKLIRGDLDQADEGEEAVTLGLKLARLESIPGLGQPVQAVAILDRILQGPASPEQHQQARFARMGALAVQNRFADAEMVARGAAKEAPLILLLPAIRLLDRLAQETENDQIRRRAGALIRTLVDRWADPIERTPAELRDEIRLRQARALLFAGDPMGARKAVARWGGPGGEGDVAELLRDLGDTYVRLEAYGLAVEIERLRATKLVAGSPAWFDARYSLALALYRSNQPREARKVVDATTILHPDLGGGETRARFERLGQKLAAD